MRTGCATVCLRRASTGKPPTFASTGYPATCPGCAFLAVAPSYMCLQVTAMASLDLALLRDYMLDTTTARPRTSCTSPTPPTARTLFVLSAGPSSSRTSTSTPPG
eukprot:1741165-Pyramimonas_sp.AAC.1